MVRVIVVNSRQILGCLIVVSLLQIGVLAMNPTPDLSVNVTKSVSSEPLDEFFSSNSSDNEFLFEERSLRKPSNRQFSGPVIYSSSLYSTAPSSSYTGTSYGTSSGLLTDGTSYSAPFSAQSQTPSGQYGNSAALTSVTSTGSAASYYGGGYRNTYSTQLGGTSALISDLYGTSSTSGNLQTGSTYGSPSANLVSSGSYNSPWAQFVAPTYSPPSALLVSSPSYSSPSAPLISVPSYSPPSAPLVSAPSYSSPSAPLVSPPSYNSPLISAPSYNTPSASLVSSPSYGPPSASLVSAPSYSSPSAPLVSAPSYSPQSVPLISAPSYSSPSAPFVSPPLYNSPSASLISAPSYSSPSAPLVSAPSYSPPSSPLVSAPSYSPPSAPLISAPSYNSPSASLVSVPSYSSPSAPLVSAPSYSPPSSQLISAPSYSPPSAPLISAPSYSPPSAPLIAAPSYNTPSAPLTSVPALVGYAQSPVYGSPSAPLTSPPAPVCTQNMYNLTIPDNTPAGVIILRILAADPQGLPLRYTILDPIFGAFEMNAQTGDLMVNANLRNFGAALEFNVQVTNTQNQLCVSSVRINFITTTVYTTPAPYYGGSSYNTGSSNLIAAPTNGGYGSSSSSSNLVSTGNSGSYGSGSSNLVALPAPASYGGGSSNLIAAPGSSGLYGGGNANLVTAPAPANTYGSASSNLVAPAPAPVIAYVSGSGAYGGGSSSLIAAPSPVTSYSGGSGSANLIVSPTPPPVLIFGGGTNSGSYGGGSSNLVGAPSPTTNYGGGSANLVSVPNSAVCPAVCYASGSVGSNFNTVATPPANPFSVTANVFGANSGGLNSAAPPPVNPFSVTANLIATVPPPIRSSAPPGFSTFGGHKDLAADGTQPTPSTMNWSFFVPNYSGSTTVVGSITGPSSNSVFSLSGNPFFAVDQTGVVSLISGYCPSRSPMQEQMTVRAVSVDGVHVIQGNLSVVVFLTPAYLRICTTQPSPPVPSPSGTSSLVAAPVSPATSQPLGNSGQNTVSVSFIGDSSFIIPRCDGPTGIPQVAATVRAKFSTNVDFSQLRITVSNSLFKPALPVVCDQTFTCDISIVFSQPLDSSFAGNYVPYIQLEGGGLARTLQNLQIQIQCNDPPAAAVPLPSRLGSVVDPSKIIAPLQPCGVANISVDVSEDVPVGSVITNLPTNGNQGFKYQIRDSSAVGYFDLVEPNSLAVASPMFQPTVDSVYLQVVGILANATVCTTNVFIGVTNVNRNRPVFDQSSYNFAIDCLLPMSLVGYVSASDIDSGRNNIRRFFVAPDDTPLVSVDPASGAIHLRQTLDDSTSFRMFVENPGTQLRSSVMVQISCTGSNQVVSAAGLGRSFRPATTTAKPIPVPKVIPAKRPIATSNKPVSFSLSVVFSNSTVSTTHATTTVDNSHQRNKSP